MITCLANKKDATQIAKIHQQEINQGFLSQLGIKFLSKVYEATIVSPNAFTVIAKDNDKVIGFISGCINVSKFYRDFYKKYVANTFLILVPKIFRISVLKKIFETIRYPRQKEKKLPEAELLTIVVLKSFHGQGIAPKMFEKFLSEMRKRGVRRFKVVVGKKLKRAIGFYEKVGFKFCSSISVHQGEPSRIYIYTL